jgi:Bacterial archaeo-eukaryotic release factor family 10
MATHPTATVRAAPRSSEQHDPQLRAGALLRELALREPSEFPIVSAYLDVRPPSDRADPGVRATRVVVRERLHEIAQSLPRHGPVHASFTADAEQIERLIDETAGERERGLAVFASSGAGLLEVLRTWTPFELLIEAGRWPSLVPLARLAGHEPALVALADTNSLRLFASQPGRLLELPAIDDPPDDYTRTEVGGWAQARYQRHVDEHRDVFARRAAAVIARTMEREGAARLILAGDEVALPRLRSALPTPIADRVQGVLRLELRATLDDIEAKALPAIAELEADDAIDAANHLVDEVGAQRLGVGRAGPTRRALEEGAALELLLDDAMPGRDADEFVRSAARSSAKITFVPEHAGLKGLGGVGALLRYRPRGARS